MKNKRILIPAWVIYGILIAAAFFAGYYAKPTGTPPEQPLNMVTIASSKNAAVIDLSSRKIFISEVSIDVNGLTQITMSNGDKFWIDGKTLSFSPAKTDVNCSDEIVVSPDLKMRHCIGVNFEFALKQFKQP